MRRNSLVLLLAAAFALGCSANPEPAQAPAPVVSAPAPAPAVSSDPAPVALTDFALSGATDAATLQAVEVTGQPFARAQRAEVKRAFPNPWDVQLGAKTQEAIAQGDVLSASFSFRTAWVPAETAEGQSEFVVELARDPWTKATTRPIVAGPEWKDYTVVFESPQDFAPGDAQVLFRLGYGAQTLEVANVVLRNYKRTKSVEELRASETKLSYAGREPEAAWRAEAEQRIDGLRKAQLSVAVKRGGKPVPGALVEIEQLDHAFGLGTCAPANMLIDPNERRFRELVKTHFNTVTLENDLKWVALAGDWGSSFKLENAQQAVAWLRQQGIDVRGHVMVWPGWKELPKFLRQYESDKPKLKSEVEKRIREIGTAMKGSLVHWDVLNEPFDNHDLMDLLGQDVMVDWFKLARKTDPAAKLFLNDYGILAGGGADNPHRQHFDATISFLLEKGAPVDAIGIQGHFASALTSPTDLLAQLDRYGRFGKPIWITEYDLVVADEALQADFTRDFYTVLFSHPAVEGVIMWGIHDATHWKKNAIMYRADYSLKPAGEAFEELFQQKWRTNEALQTDPSGKAGVRGFMGRYRITASGQGKTREVIAELEKGGTEVIVNLQ